MVTHDVKIEKIKEWRTISAIMFPISFLFVFLAYFIAYIFKDKLLILSPYLTTYVIGFGVGYFFTEKFSKFSEWLTHAEGQPNMRFWFLFGVTISYFIAVSVSFIYATLLRIEYTLDKWLIGWGLLFGVTTFMGYYGGASLYIYKKTGEVIDVV